MTARAHDPQGASIPKRVSDCTLLLTVLRAAHGRWLSDLYRTTGCMVHSRVADLRRRGHRIECRRIGIGEYEYRLVKATPLRGTLAGSRTRGGLRSEARDGRR